MAWTDALVDFVEKTALLRETIKRRGDEEHYAARMNRIAQKLDALAAALEEHDPAAAAAVRSAWGGRCEAWRSGTQRTGRGKTRIANGMHLMRGCTDARQCSPLSLFRCRCRCLLSLVGS